MQFMFRPWSSHSAPKPAESRTRRPRRSRPGLEALEGRQLLSLGSELAGNVFTAGQQRLAVNASAPDGRSVIAWVDGTSSSNRGVEFRLFNSSGPATTSDLPVPGSGGATPEPPSVAMDSQGNFVVVWTEPAANFDTNILAQRFNSSGSPIGSNIFIASNSLGARSPDVAMDAAGNFVVAYERQGTGAQDTDVIVKRYNNTGAFQGSVNVQSSSSFDEQKPSVAMAADGRFAVAYEWSQPGSTDSHIWTTSHFANGARHKGFDVAITAGDEENPDIAMNNSGDLVVAYTLNSFPDSQVKVRRATFDGGLEDMDIDVSLDDEHDQQVAMNRTGRSFVVAYDATVGPGVSEVRVVEFDQADGRSEQSPSPGALNAAVSMGPNGRYLVTYQRKVGTDENIFRRRGSFSAF